MPGFDDGAADDAAHGRVDFDRRHVLRDVAHPEPIGRVKRQVVQAEQTLAVAGFRDGFFGQTEDIVRDLSDGSLPQPPHSIHFSHGSPSASMSDAGTCPLDYLRSRAVRYEFPRSPRLSGNPSPEHRVSAVELPECVSSIATRGVDS